MNIVIARITKTNAIFSVVVLIIGILNCMISQSSFIIAEEVKAQKVEESEKKRKRISKRKMYIL